MRSISTRYSRDFFLSMIACVLGICLSGCAGIKLPSSGQQQVDVSASFAYQKAQRLFDSGQFEQAIAVWEQIPPADPKYIDAQLGIRNARLKMTRVAQQETSSFQTETEYSALLEQGEALEEEGRYQDALLAYTQALEMQPENSELQRKIETLSTILEDAIQRHEQLGELYLSKGEYEKSKAEWEQLLQLVPDHAVAQQRLADLEILSASSDAAFVQRGRSLMQKGLTVQAQEEFQKALRVNPNNAQTQQYLSTLGNIPFTPYQVKKGDTLSSIAQQYSQNVSDYMALADFNHLPPDATLQVGQTLNIPHIVGFKAKLAPQAQDVFAEPSVAPEEPQSSDVREITPISAEERTQQIQQTFQQGVAAYDAGNYREAVALFNEVYQSDPENIEAYNYFLKAMTKLQDGNLESETPQQEPQAPVASADSAEEEVDLMLITADSYRENGDLQKAISVYEQALRLSPENPEIIELLDEVREELQTQITAHLNEGIKLFNQEAIEEAIAEWDIVLQLEPSNQQANDYKKRAQKMLEALKPKEGANAEESEHPLSTPPAQEETN